MPPKRHLTSFMGMFTYKNTNGLSGSGLMVFHGCTFPTHSKPLQNTTQKSGFGVILIPKLNCMVVVTHSDPTVIFVPKNKRCPVSKKKVFVMEDGVDFTFSRNTEKYAGSTEQLEKTHMSIYEVIAYKCKTRAQIVAKLKPYVVAILTVNTTLIEE